MDDSFICKHGQRTKNEFTIYFGTYHSYTCRKILDRKSLKLPKSMSTNSWCRIILLEIREWVCPTVSSFWRLSTSSVPPGSDTSSDSNWPYLTLPAKAYFLTLPTVSKMTWRQHDRICPDPVTHVIDTCPNPDTHVTVSALNLTHTRAHALSLTPTWPHLPWPWHPSDRTCPDHDTHASTCPDHYTHVTIPALTLTPTWSFLT